MAMDEFNIESFEDLKFAQEQIRKDNKDIELAIKDNPVVKISSSLLGGESVKDTFVNNLSVSKNRQTGAKMIKALLLANKITRKYFVGYTIAKEMVPYTLQKVNQLLHHKK
jgi:hypothetical protein